MNGASTAELDRRAALGARFRSVRALTESITAPLEVEDHVVQTMEDVSPPKWHLAHTTWFFETFVLERFAKEHRPFDAGFSFLFNSYYDAVGARVERPRRGELSRPTVAEIRRYRAHVDGCMEDLLRGLDPRRRDAFDLVELGLQHEQQHQELLLADIRHILAANPSRPAYVERRAARERVEARPLEWIEVRGGLVEVGHPGGSFGFDNEFPRHRVWLEDFALSDRLITNGEFLTFVESGGYGRSELWLADGWEAVRSRGWSAPLGWEKIGDAWHETTLHGRAPIELDLPVAHVSHFEADAFARWRGARLPTEFEWEHAASALDSASTIRGANLFDGTRFAPERAPRSPHPRLVQMFGDLWQWTSSAYLAYPGFAPWPGAIGEYNGKFMSGQIVLRGGSCATPRDHIRASYRNFFQPDKRWQFTGIRLARGR